jgi:peptidoglycan-associated lipoprotein
MLSLAAVVAAGGWLVLGLAANSRADIFRYKARVYTDRREPTHFVPVDDFRVNETISDEGGVRYLMVRGADGVFQVAFKDISEVQFVRFLGYRNADIAEYDSRVYCQSPDVIRFGVIQLQVMLGISDGQAWYLRPRSMVDRGAGLMKIMFGDGDSQGRPMPAEAEESRRAIAILPPLPAPAPPPAAAAAGDPFDAMTLDELNAKNPLMDVLFDFDKSNLLSQAQATLQRNAEWLRAHPTTKVTVEGYADPRGTNEYNLDLGERRAVSVRDFMLKAGIAASRMTSTTKGRTQQFCPEPTEPCFAQNRRGHFLFTAK